MNRDLTELVFILDRSGSMHGLEADTIGGFNAMIEKQKREPGEALITTVLFDSRIEMLHDRVKLSEIMPMTDKDYQVQGCTALLDAVGQTIEHIGHIHKYAREEDVPAHTMFVITTDGMENASEHFSYPQVKRLIEQKKEAQNWEFLFIGANIDAVHIASQMGISKDRAANYVADSEGTSRVFGSISAPISAMRANMSISPQWADELEEDTKKRGKQNKNN